MIDFKDVLHFWFQELSPEQWWKKDEKLDLQIKERFFSTYEKASHCELWEWRETPLGRLAEIIVLDQFPRNMFRGQAQSFETDPLALSLSQAAVQAGDDKKLESGKKSFLYMPFMHSESPKVHQVAVHLFSQPGLEFNLDFELKHKAIIDRFGRYPHRNHILNRSSTKEELEFLKTPGSSF